MSPSLYQRISLWGWNTLRVYSHLTFISDLPQGCLYLSSDAWYNTPQLPTGGMAHNQTETDWTSYDLLSLWAFRSCETQEAPRIIYFGGTPIDVTPKIQVTTQFGAIRRHPTGLGTPTARLFNCPTSLSSRSHRESPCLVTLVHVQFVLGLVTMVDLCTSF